MTVRLIPVIALFRGYRLGFLFVFLALTILLFIAPVLLQVDRYSDYFFSIKSGFVPEFYAEFPLGTKMDEIGKKVRDSYPESTIYTGILSRVEDVSFTTESGNSIKRTTTLLGLNFDSRKTLSVQSAGKTGDCNVDGVVHMGSWLFTLSNCLDLSSGEATAQLNGSLVEGELYADEASSIFVIPSDSEFIEQTEARQEFLGTFFQKYFSVERSGIGMDRFLSDESSQSEFEVFRQRPMQAYADIVFNGTEDDLPVLLSTRLMEDVGAVGVGMFTKVVTGDKTTDVRIVDSFSFSPEGTLNPYLVLGSQQTIARIVPDVSAQIPVLIAQGSLNRLQGIQSLVTTLEPAAQSYNREDLQPSFLLQKRYIEIAQTVLLAFILLIPPLILFVKLFRFYVANNDQIILLSIYGFRWPVFSTATVFITLLSGLVSVLMAEILFNVNNSLLRTYFFPEVTLDITRNLFILGYVALVILIILLVEVSLLRRIRYAERGMV